MAYSNILCEESSEKGLETQIIKKDSYSLEKEQFWDMLTVLGIILETNISEF